ncbi:bifunctional biotin--[acetyl-CoA-carboxylase] ligase/biotin operon repressor BirA [Thiococcus pfennigii]|uniref:bifunctional biotin--[acetyl-CoA-carboxylase] ligase/biotin operon repressor BirA n=2 Tax=Thiococcus pfennigii TaxID=1057 RepID=UPI0030B881CC
MTAGAAAAVPPTHLAVLRLLADGELHSGEAIAARLGLSRTAVWKALEKLAGLGIEVATLRGRGYRLVEPLELLDAGRIQAGLSAGARARLGGVEVHASLGSTNSHLMELAKHGVAGGRVCLAEHQERGRGRHGRTWVSPFGRSLLLSVLWRYDFGIAGLAGLSLAAGAAVADALRAQGVADIALKWPNDLLWHGRKLAGLLLEAAGEAHGSSHVVIGLGLNLSLTPRQAAEIDQPWVDLATALGRPAGRIERNRLAATLIEALIEALDRFGREGLAPFLPLWEASDPYRGEPIAILIGSRTIDGIHGGIAEDGALRVLTEIGEQTFQAGEVSLRPPRRT